MSSLKFLVKESNASLLFSLLNSFIEKEGEQIIRKFGTYPQKMRIDIRPLTEPKFLSVEIHGDLNHICDDFIEPLKNFLNNENKENDLENEEVMRFLDELNCWQIVQLIAYIDETINDQ